jgi:hypothetical protein
MVSNATHALALCLSVGNGAQSISSLCDHPPDRGIHLQLCDVEVEARHFLEAVLGARDLRVGAAQLFLQDGSVFLSRGKELVAFSKVFVAQFQFSNFLGLFLKGSSLI